MRTFAFFLLAALVGCAGPVSRPTGDSAVGQPRSGAQSEVAIARGDDVSAQRRQLLLQSGLKGLATQEVGYYLDIQEARLRQEFAGTDIDIARSGDRLTLVLPGTAMFDSGSTRLHSSVLPPLADIARVLKEYRKTLVTVEGHTDSEGDEDYNQRLSEQRALAVARYLASKGIEPERLIVLGYGESRPVGDNASPEGRARNRRVVLTLSPVAE